MDVVVSPDCGQLTSSLENFTESVDSTYGCLLAGGRVVTATHNWWLLHPDELCLLSLLVWAEPRAALSDSPVFLPVKSPTVPFRLVVFELAAEVRVVGPFLTTIDVFIRCGCVCCAAPSRAWPSWRGWW